MVLCRKDAEGALETTRRWMASIGLRLNETKTRICDARCETFDFLGYMFGPRYWPVNGRRYTAATPSKKAVRRLRERVRGLLSPGNQAPWPEVAASLNRILRGWANYFCYGTRSAVRKSVDWAVYDRTRYFLRRRHKRASRGTRQFPWPRVFGELGVLSLRALSRQERANALA